MRDSRDTTYPVRAFGHWSGHRAETGSTKCPHCNGGGYRDPSAAAAMRGIKAEGGWGVIFTEQCEVHHTSEITPFIELRLWEDKDVPMLARMAGKMKEHGALAGIQLAYSGVNGPNFYSREVPLAVSAQPIRTFTNDPLQARALDKSEIKDLRRWFVNAAERSRSAGFDLICLYGAHGFGIFQHFLSRATNHRGDEYGGSLENRSRFVNEVVADIRDAVGDTMGITLRVSLDETIGDLGFSNARGSRVHRDEPKPCRTYGTWPMAPGTIARVPAGSRTRLRTRNWSGAFPELTEKAHRRGRTLYLARCHGPHDQFGNARFLSAVRAPPLPIPSFPERSTRVGSKTFANALAAISASPVT